MAPAARLPAARATPAAQRPNPIAEPLAHHEKAHDLGGAQDLEKRLLFLSEEGRFISTELEHLGKNLGSLLIGELFSRRPNAQTCDPASRATLSLKELQSLEAEI